MWWMSLIYFAFVTGQYGLTFWMPTFIKSTGVTGAFNIGLLSAIPFLVAIVVMNVLGHSADKHRERRWHLIVPALAAHRLFDRGFVRGQHGVSIIALSLPRPAC